MKGTKTIALLLSATMLAGIFTGCAGKTTKITTDKFINACEKLDLKGFEVDGKKAPDIDDLEEGFYLYADTDAIEEAEDSIDDFLDEIGLDDVFEAENVKSFAFAAKCDGFDLNDLLDRDVLGSTELDGAAAFQMTLDGNYAEDFMAYLEDLLDECGISTDDLSDKEYFVSKNEGYLRYHVEIDKLVEQFVDNDAYDDIYDFLYYFTDGLIDSVEDFSGDAAFSFEINGSNIFFILGLNVNTDETSVLNDFVKAFGATCNPMDVPVNEDISENLIDDYLDDLADQIAPGPDPVTPTTPDNSGATKVGISMPTIDLQRWYQDGDNLKKGLESMGYAVDLQYAANDISTQIAQIEGMINSGCDLLIIACIESSSLNDVLEDAKANNIPVIAYDRLIMNSDAVSYYVTFDNYQVGRLQAQYIVDTLQLDNSSGSYNIELMAGDPSDIAAAFFYTGAMDVLMPYIESGKLVVVSGQTSFDECAIDHWKTETAMARAENIISSYYSDGRNIDAWLCPNDSTALGVIQALDARNYSVYWPVVTGQDCDIANMRCMIEGKQTMSVFKETKLLVDETVFWADKILGGFDVTTDSSYNNNAKDVPTFFCTPIVVDINNYRTVLIDPGYYTEDDIF